MNTRANTMDFNQFPRTAVWTGEIPRGSCFDTEGPFMTDSPMSMGFNVIPRNLPLHVAINHLKSTGGLKAFASCTANRVGTVDTEVLRMVSLYMSDQAMARLIESLASQPDGFVIYDMKKSEVFGDANMWNAVTENAPGQRYKYLYLALCYDFGHVSGILDDYIQSNYNRRQKLSMLTNFCVLCTVGMSYFICDSMKKKYKLPNIRPIPGDLGTMYCTGLVTH